jgi:hypothetical protein
VAPRSDGPGTHAALVLSLRPDRERDA